MQSLLQNKATTCNHATTAKLKARMDRDFSDNRPDHISMQTCVASLIEIEIEIERERAFILVSFFSKEWSRSLRSSSHVLPPNGGRAVVDSGPPGPTETSAVGSSYLPHYDGQLKRYLSIYTHIYIYIVIIICLYTCNC